MDMQKIAVVAGGTAGVGRATLTALIDEGYKVGVLARGEDRLTGVAATYGADVMTLACDVSDATAVTKAAISIEEGLGPIDVWINCAMLTSFSPFMEVEPEEFQAIVDTTFMGTVNGTRAALSVMKPRGRGRIVTVGSGLGYRSVPLQSAYCASKHAINGFLSSVRSELIHDRSNITIGVVQLPAINTPQFDWAKNRLEMKPQPAPPIYQPEVAARAVMKAVREGSREILVGQSVLKLVFGNMVLPNLMDNILASAGTEQQKSELSDPGERPGNIDGPNEEISARARGSYGDRAQDGGLVVDGDQARIGVFFGLPLIALGVGLAVGNAVAQRRQRR